MNLIADTKLLGAVAVSLCCIPAWNFWGPTSPEAPASTQQDEERRSDQQPVDLDSLIDSLPPAEHPRPWNEEAKERQEDPANKTLRRELGRSLHPSDDQWRRLLLQKGVIRHRDKWPDNVPFAIGIRVPAWLPDGDITLDSTNPGLESAVAHSGTGGCGTCAARGTEREDYQELGMLSLGSQELTFDVTIKAKKGGGFFRAETEGPPPGLLWSGQVTLTTEVVASLEEAVPPLASEEVNSDLRNAVGVGFYQSAAYPRPMPYIVVDEDDKSRSRLAGVALIMEGALLKDGNVVETVSLDAGVYDEDTLTWDSVDVVGMRLAHSAVEKLPAKNEADARSLEGWTIRVRGMNKGVLGYWGADRWWSGSVEIPLSVAIEREDERFQRMPRPPWQWPD